MSQPNADYVAAAGCLAFAVAVIALDQLSVKLWERRKNKEIRELNKVFQLPSYEKAFNTDFLFFSCGNRRGYT